MRRSPRGGHAAAIPGRGGRTALLIAVVLGVALVLAGVGVAVHGALADGPGPATVVRQYFAALDDQDASAALGYGTTPAGSHALLTDAVLRAQHGSAPLHDLAAETDSVTGRKAQVRVSYRAGTTAVTTRVGLHRQDGTWRLDETAVPTRLVFSAAADRARIAGVQPFAGTALVFPGVLPIRFDTGYLAGAVATGTVTFGAPRTTGIDVRLTRAGSAAAQRAVRTALAGCLRRGGVTCPQPGERYVPGSLRGSTTGSLDDLKTSLTDASTGVVRVDATIPARVTYRRLNFYNRASDGSGRVQLDIHALVDATQSTRVRWTS